MTINANGTVHLGVRPRAVPAPASTSMNNDGLLAAAAAAAETVKQGRRPGYGELGSEAETDGPDTKSSTSRLPAGVQDGGSSVSQGNHIDGRETTPTSTSTSTSTDRRARPKMTLEQAVTQYDQTHPPSTASSHTTTTANAPARQTQHPPVQQVKDDVRSHDGVYTYDYTNANHPPGSKAGHTAPGAGDNQDPHVRGYPEAPVRDDAYGVPFGKRLKAMIKLRRDAEEAGLVPRPPAYSSSSELSAAAAVVEQAGSMVVGLVTRPATSLGVDGSGYRKRCTLVLVRTRGKRRNGLLSRMKGIVTGRRRRTFDQARRRHLDHSPHIAIINL
ncbi:hypothetical protein QFC22_004249 [Naganishia vaughanmartiniae]|uniref:Uncharacterized protein n=1 Tax=Naganishia vaughanmartiniae TaxID=1424756 RepID=A0ACC2X4L3_9TREE|nr:hypothetical protein QFC22_004249 [Naganishia vaughanmartiniae]